MPPDYGHMTEDALRILDLLCRRPSVSAEGRALDETAELVEELLAGTGFETRQLRANGGAPAVYGDQPGKGDFTLLLYNHYDVQPVDPLDLWDSPPFEPTQRDGKLFARGTGDNKGELAVRLAVIRALRDEHGELPVRVRWIVEGEEEVGSTTFDEIVRGNVELLRADGALWEGGGARLPDGRPEFGLGFKGALGVRLDVTALATDAHSSLEAIAPSAPWRLVQALASIRDRDGTVRIPGFYDRVLPATDAERQAIAESSFSDEDELREMLGLDAFVDGLSGAELWERASFRPTSNIAGVDTGYSGPGFKTVLPAAASAWMDFRLVPEQHPDEILELLRAHLEREGFGDIEVTPIVAARPAKTPLDDPFVRVVVEVAEAVSGETASISPLSGGTLPIIASLQDHLGVPGLSAPGNPLYAGARVHAPNEHIRLEDIEPALRFTYELLLALGDSVSEPD
jgi:acetylornithine deacetylase/succinyl-diaminopimelate desuccinylase-like protein